MFGCIGLLGLNGCNDSFLERYPETSITEDGFLIMQVIWKPIRMVCTEILLPVIRMCLLTI